MEISVIEIIIVALLMLALIVFLIQRNNRDREKFEDQENQIKKPEKHDEPRT